MTREPLIDIRHLKKYFPIKTGLFNRVVGHVKAVDDVTFRIYKGKRSDWSANRAAANRRWAARFSNCRSRAAARCILTASRCSR